MTLRLTTGRLFTLRLICAEPCTSYDVSVAAIRADINNRRDGRLEWADGFIAALRRHGLIEDTGGMRAKRSVYRATEAGRKALLSEDTGHAADL